jgi:hypothetical protein
MRGRAHRNNLQLVEAGIGPVFCPTRGGTYAAAAADRGECNRAGKAEVA